MARNTFLLLASALLALAACSRPSDASYYNRGGPEALLDMSSEVVKLSLAGPAEMAQLTSWVEQDQPTRAELHCNSSTPNCIQAQELLAMHGVPTTSMGMGDGSVALVYERVLARDCNQRYIDNHSNNYNAPHAAFGCSISANIVQHVSDKQQFVNPNLTDTPPATGGLAAYERAYTPREPGQGGVAESLISEGASK